MPDSCKKKKKLYDDSSVISALAAVRNGSSFRVAAEKYGIPTSTLRDRYHGKYDAGKHSPGPSLGLTWEQEDHLKKHILYMARIGYGISKKDIPQLIKEILNRAEGEDPDTYNVENRRFKDNTPSIAWVYRYLNRHPELSCRVPENLGHQRARVNENQVRGWFTNLVTFLREEHQIDAEEFFSNTNASRIFNLDESGFPLAGTTGKLKIITARGAKNVYKLAPDTKEQITVLGCVSAAGNFQKPFVIFPGVRPKFNLNDVQAEDYDLRTSHNGWISADSFFGWLSNLFFPSIQNKVTFPIILFMDGHASHINLAVSAFCVENNIILYCFPPHASHVIQPLDVSVYGPLKKYWNHALNEFANQYKGLAMTRTHFFKVFDCAWKKCIENKQTVASGFRKCGLVPLNPDAVAYDRLMDRAQLPIRHSKSKDLMENVGMTRMYQLYESCLTDELKELFSLRYVKINLT